MKKLVALAVALIMVLGIVSACKPETDATTTPVPTGSTTLGTTVAPKVGLQGNLNVLSFTNELKIMAIAFMAKNPQLNVSFEMVSTDDGAFQEKARAVADTDQCPDVIALEAAFVKAFVEQDNFLMDIGDLRANAVAMETYENSINVGTAPNGEVRAYSYQYTPAAFFYRRSIAEKYLGSSDPVEVQKAVADWDKFLETAEKLKNDSNGAVLMLAGVDEFTRPYYANRSKGWVIDNTLNIDPKLDELLDMAKTFGEKNLTLEVNQWDAAWFASMNGPVQTADGKQVEVFSYFMPTWGVTYLLANNAKLTSGDYAICEGPTNWQWGGTWAGVMKNAKNVENAKEFIRFICFDEEHLTNWATGVYTWEYLYNIDPVLTGEQVENDDGTKSGLSQGAGDFVSSKVVINKLMPDVATPVIGGQNNYDVFDKIAPKVKTDLMTGWDEAVEGKFGELLRTYAYTDQIVDKDDFYEKFTAKIEADMPTIIVE